MMQYLYLCACYIDLIHSLSNSYTISTRAIWDLLPEPKDGGETEGEGNKSHAARGGGVVELFLSLQWQRICITIATYLLMTLSDHNHNNYSSSMVTV